MAWISFGSLPCRKNNLMTVRVSMLLKSRASRLASELVSNPVGLRTYQHPGIRIVINEISKMDGNRLPSQRSHGNPLFQMSEYYNKNTFKYSPRISVIQKPQSKGEGRRATDFITLVLTVSDIRRNAKSFRSRNSNLSQPTGTQSRLWPTHDRPSTDQHSCTFCFSQK